MSATWPQAKEGDKFFALTMEQIVAYGVAVGNAAVAMDLAIRTPTEERTQQQVADLAALVKQLVRAIRYASPGHKLADKAMGYLHRNGLVGSPLRVEIDAKDAP